MEKSEKVTLLSTIILVGFTIGVVYHYILAQYLHLGELYNSFVYPAKWAFCDFWGILEQVSKFAPYNKVTLWGCYFPLAYLIMYPFLLLKNMLLAYTVYVLPAAIYFSYMNIKNFGCENLTKVQNFQNIFTLSVVSYPVLYNLDKGNFDMILFILIGVWAWLWVAKKDLAGAVLLGVINAIKPFTVLFLIIYLKEKKYKEIFASVFVTLLLVAIGFLIFPGGFVEQLQIFMKNQLLFKYIYAQGNEIGLGFNSCLFTPLKAIMLHYSLQDVAINSFIKVYDWFCYALTGVTLFFVWREKSFWKQLLLLMANFLLVPYCTYDYKLIFLYIPLWFFINEKVRTKLDLAYIIGFSLLFIPKNIVISLPLIKNGVQNWITFSSIVNPLILLFLSGLVVYGQFFESRLRVSEEKNEV